MTHIRSLRAAAAALALVAVCAPASQAQSADGQRNQIRALLQAEFNQRQQNLDNLLEQMQRERQELRALAEALRVLGIETPGLAAAQAPSQQVQGVQPQAGPAAPQGYGVQQAAPQAAQPVAPQPSAPVVAPAPQGFAPLPLPLPTQGQQTVQQPVQAQPQPTVQPQVAPQQQPAPQPVAVQQPEPQRMTPDAFDDALRQHGRFVNRSGNVWEFYFDNVRMRAVADAQADRMRISAYIRPARRTKESQLVRALEANFQSTQDARYSIEDDKLYALFAHPLSSLQPKQLHSGLREVANLAENFGTTYSAGSAEFGGR